MKNLPTIRQLQYLIALHEQQHFSRAAEQCFISQSAFSIAIRELETTLDCQLFERTNRSVRTTRLGEEVINNARQVLSALEQLSNTAANRKDPLAGQLNLGVIPTIAPFLLPKLLNKFKRSYPTLELVLREEPTPAAYESLMSGKLDVILVALPYDLPNCTVSTLFNDRFHLAFRSNSRWLAAVSKYANQAPKNLPDDAVILLEDGHCLRDHTISQCRFLGARRQAQLSQYSSTSMTTLLHMVSQDLGVTYVPEMALNSAVLKSLRIKTMPMGPKSSRDIGLAWRQESAFAADYQQLAATIKAACQP